MRTHLLLSAATLTLALHLNAQAPQRMSYQAVVRDEANALVTNATVGMRLSILQGSATGTAVYVETHSAPTNANGLVSVEVGGGAVQSGSMEAIDWASGPYFLRSETDPNGGGNYTIAGTSQLLSVPYALYAANSEPGPPGPQGMPGADGCAPTITDSLIVLYGGKIAAYFEDTSQLGDEMMGEYMLGLKRQSDEEIGRVCHER